MDTREMIVGITAGVAVAVLVVWLLIELLVRAFAGYASSEEPRSAELIAQIAFFVYRHGVSGGRGVAPGPA